MPSVPRYNQQVQTQALPGVRLSSNAPVEAFGGGAAVSRVYSAVGDVVESMSKVVEAQKKDADEAWAQNAYADLQSQATLLYYHPEEGVAAQRGEKAFNASEVYGKKFDDFVNKYSEKINNSEQEIAFNKLKDRVGTNFRNDIDKHVFKETESYKDNKSKAAIEAARNEAVLNYSDPVRVRESMRLQETIAMERLKGQSPEVVKETLLNLRSQTNSEIVSRMLTLDQDIAASEFYQKNKDGGFNAKDMTEVEKILQEGSTRGESNRISMSLISKYKDNQRAAYAEAEKIPSEKLQRATITALDNKYSRLEHIKKQEDNRRFDNSAVYVEKNLKRPPEATWLALDDGQRKAIDSRIAQLHSGKDIPKNGETYYALRKMAATNPGKFQGIHLPRLFAEVPSDELSSLINLQMDLATGKANKDLDGLRTNDQIIKQTLAGIGVDPTPKDGSKDAKRVDAFYRKIDELSAQQAMKEGRPLKNEEVQKIADDLLMETGEDSFLNTISFGMFGQSKKRIYEAKPGESVALNPKDLSPTEREKISDALKRSGVPVTEENIMYAWTTGVSKRVNRGK